MIAREGLGALIYLHQTSKGFNVDDEKRLAFHREARQSAPAHQRKTQRSAAANKQTRPARTKKAASQSAASSRTRTKRTAAK